MNDDEGMARDRWRVERKEECMREEEEGGWVGI